MNSTATDITEKAQSAAARGLALMAQRNRLSSLVVDGPEKWIRDEATSLLETWQSGLTESDWEALAVAEYAAAMQKGKAGRRALVERYADVSPLGQRR